MDLKSLDELRVEWELLIKRLESQFMMEPDLQAILFLIGVQELGQGYREYSKQEKQDLMHIAICRLLSDYGFYELEGIDESGWPNWKLTSEIPQLSLKDQDILLKQSAINYFREEIWSISVNYN